MRPTHAGCPCRSKVLAKQSSAPIGWSFSGPLVARTAGVDAVVLDASERVGGHTHSVVGDSGRLAVGLTHWGGEETAVTCNRNKDGRFVRVRTRRTPCSPG